MIAENLDFPTDENPMNNVAAAGDAVQVAAGARPKEFPRMADHEAATDATELAAVVGGLRNEMAQVVGVLRQFTDTTSVLIGNIAQQSQSQSQSRSHSSRHHQDRQVDSSSSDDYDSHHFANSFGRTRNVQTHHSSNQNQRGCRIPPFTGKESWKIWYNRFTEIAYLKRWDEAQKLEEILPRLQGQAGEFVYEQLSHQVRTNYQSLTSELNNRFRVVETQKTFATQFSNRNQNSGETPEEFAAELKRLYGKAYANRDSQTREEDLLRKFLNGLQDERARFHVEYIKEPANIDEAVYEVVNFREVHKRPFSKDSYYNQGNNRKPTRMVRFGYDSGEDDQSDNEDCSRVNRAYNRTSKAKSTLKVDEQQAKSDNDDKSETNKAKDSTPDVSNDMSNLKGLLTTLVKEVADEFKKEMQAGKPQRFYGNQNPKPMNSSRPRNNFGGARQTNSNNQQQRYGNNFKYGTCFKCGQEGHFARECPNLPWVTGQMQMAVQPSSSFQNPGMPPNENQTASKSPVAGSAPEQSTN